MSAIGEGSAALVVNIIQKCTGISSEMLHPSNWKKPLTGLFYKLTAADMVYIIFEIENALQIRLPPQAFKDYGCCSIDGICAAIQKCQ